RESIQRTVVRPTGRRPHRLRSAPQAGHPTRTHTRRYFGGRHMPNKGSGSLSASTRRSAAASDLETVRYENARSVQRLPSSLNLSRLFKDYERLFLCTSVCKSDRLLR